MQKVEKNGPAQYRSPVQIHGQRPLLDGSSFTKSRRAMRTRKPGRIAIGYLEKIAMRTAARASTPKRM